MPEQGAAWAGARGIEFFLEGGGGVLLDPNLGSTGSHINQ